MTPIDIDAAITASSIDRSIERVLRARRSTLSNAHAHDRSIASIGFRVNERANVDRGRWMATTTTRARARARATSIR